MDSKGAFGKLRKPINNTFQIYKFLLYGCQNQCAHPFAPLQPK